MAQIAKEAGLGRESLYKALSIDAHTHALKPFMLSYMPLVLNSSLLLKTEIEHVGS
jgi:hypothetical protein